MQMETQGLVLRPIEDGDLDALCDITGDAVAMAAWERTFSREETQEIIAKYTGKDNLREMPLSWAVTDKVSADFMGMVALKMINTELVDMPEVGYMFRRKYWGQGYATVAARAVLNFAFSELDLPELCATIKADNAASIAVALRLGMYERGRFIRHYEGKDMPHITFVKQRG